MENVSRLRESVEAQKISLSQVVLLVALVLSIGLNGYLWRAHRLASTEISRSTTSRAKTIIGAVVSDFTAKDASFHDVHVSWKDAPLNIVYYFSPDCVWCQRNAAALKSLIGHTHQNYRFIALSPIPADPESLAKTSTSGADILVTRLPSSLVKELNLLPTPDTFVIDNNGVVLDHWTGAYGGDNRQAIVNYFKISAKALAPVGE